MAASNTLQIQLAAWLHQADEAPLSPSAPASGTHNLVEVRAVGDDTSAMLASMQSIARSQERQTELLGRQTALLEALVMSTAAAKPAAAPVQQTQAMQTEDALSTTTQGAQTEAVHANKAAQTDAAPAADNSKATQPAPAPTAGWPPLPDAAGTMSALRHSRGTQTDAAPAKKLQAWQTVGGPAAMQPPTAVSKTLPPPITLHRNKALEARRSAARIYNASWTWRRTPSCCCCRCLTTTARFSRCSLFSSFLAALFVSAVFHVVFSFGCLPHVSMAGASPQASWPIGT